MEIGMNREWTETRCRQSEDARQGVMAVEEIAA